MSRPLEGLLDRESAREFVRPIAERTCELLRELVDDGTYVLRRCEVDGGGESALPALYLYRHILEMGDAIEALIPEGVADAAVPLVRSMLEARLTLLYLLQDRDAYVDRAHSFLAGWALERIESIQKFDQSTRAGVAFVEHLKQDYIGEVLGTIDHSEDAKKELAYLNDYLALGHLRPFKEKYDELRAGHPERRHIYWARLHGGPGDLWGIAEKVRRRMDHKVFYRPWSRMAHAGDVRRFFNALPDYSGYTLRPLRESREMLAVAQCASQYLLEAKEGMLNHFREGEDSYRRWYVKRIRERFLWLQSLPPLYASTPEAPDGHGEETPQGKSS